MTDENTTQPRDPWAFMTERITEKTPWDAPNKYSLKSENDAVIKPYATYDLFYEITFEVLNKLGAYEDLGTPAELAALKEAAEKEQQ